MPAWVGQAGAARAAQLADGFGNQSRHGAFQDEVDVLKK